MKIVEIKENKKKYIELLLLGDEQESMIDKYLDAGRMFVLDDNGVKAECVVTDEGGRVLEIKNIATYPQHQKKGYAMFLIKFIEQEFKDEFDFIRVGTGDSPATVPFYEKCGFIETHRVKNFFCDNYDHPIFECGIQLIDMVYLGKKIKI